MYSDTLYKHEAIGVTTMLIWGEDDSILVEGTSGGICPYIRGPVAVHTIPNCSHWVQEDRPETVNKLIWDFLLDMDVSLPILPQEGSESVGTEAKVLNSGPAGNHI